MVRFKVDAYGIPYNITQPAIPVVVPNPIERPMKAIWVSG